MKVYISNFYQIRYFDSHTIPLSTCVYDQPWYHDFNEDKTHIFINKDNVLCGLRIDCLRPRNTSCHGQPCEKSPKTCDFMCAYRKQLSSINFRSFISSLEKLEKKLQKQLSLSHEITFVLIVYEAESNKCSERQALKAWFNKNKMKLEEWKRNEDLLLMS